MKTRHYVLAAAVAVLCSNVSATLISTEETYDTRTSLNSLAPDDVLEIVPGGHLILNDRADHDGPLSLLLNGGDVTSTVDYKFPDNNTGLPAFIGIYDGIFTANQFESFGIDRDATVEIGISGTMIVQSGYLPDYSGQTDPERRLNPAVLIDTGAVFPSAGLTLDVQDLGGGAVGITAIPEPATLSLLGLGGLMMLLRRRK